MTTDVTIIHINSVNANVKHGSFFFKTVQISYLLLHFIDTIFIYMNAHTYFHIYTTFDRKFMYKFRTQII